MPECSPFRLSRFLRETYTLVQKIRDYFVERQRGIHSLVDVGPELNQRRYVLLLPCQADIIQTEAGPA